MNIIEISKETSPFLFLILVSLLVYYIGCRMILPLIRKFARDSETVWDDLFVRRRVFYRLFHFVPALIISIGLPFVLSENSVAYVYLSKLLNVYIIGVIFFVFDAVLSVLVDAYNQFSATRRLPIKGSVQAIKLLAFIYALILVLSQLMGKSPVFFLSGLGAVTAVLLLIFKDAILGLVAGIQLSANDMVRRGDWIEMPKHGVDGDVIDISLTTVLVQNWDKTISSIPAYELVSSSFRNWRGMSNSGGRRIKRSILIDLNTIKFADEKLLDRFKKFSLLRPYLDSKVRELTEFNKVHVSDDDLDVLVNGRRLTNVGTFRAYCVAYLRKHPKIHQDMTFLVRQLEPTPLGLPLQIYVFSNDTRWVEYEGIQSDIFDHLLAVLREFDLRVYQQVAGPDVFEAVERMRG